MKRPFFASASFGALAIATGAQAADLPHKPPVPVPPPIWTWSGFYVGGTLGVGVGSHRIANDPATSFDWLTNSGRMTSTGVVGGVEAGYNYQFNQAVVGVEADLSGTSLSRSVTVASAGVPDAFTSRLEALATVRGRVGWAFDRFLVYGTGGVAFAELKDRLLNTTIFPFTASARSELTGWTLGGGVEYAFDQHWTAKAEYLHVGLPDRRTFDNAGNGYAFNFRDSVDIGRVGINYKF